MTTELEQWLDQEVARLTAAAAEAAKEDPRFVHGTGVPLPARSKFDGFVFALRLLCKAHGVTLSTSGYDGLQVWNLDEQSGPLHCNGIEDRTKPNAVLTGAAK